MMLPAGTSITRCPERSSMSTSSFVRTHRPRLACRLAPASWSFASQGDQLLAKGGRIHQPGAPWTGPSWRGAHTLDEGRAKWVAWRVRKSISSLPTRTGRPSMRPRRAAPTQGSMAISEAMPATAFRPALGTKTARLSRTNASHEAGGCSRTCRSPTGPVTHQAQHARTRKRRARHHDHAGRDRGHAGLRHPRFHPPLAIPHRQQELGTGRSRRGSEARHTQARPHLPPDTTEPRQASAPRHSRAGSETEGSPRVPGQLPADQFRQILDQALRVHGSAYNSSYTLLRLTSPRAFPWAEQWAAHRRGRDEDAESRARQPVLPTLRAAAAPASVAARTAATSPLTSAVTRPAPISRIRSTSRSRP